MSKPDWKDAPEWANWLGQDLNGSLWWYGHKPYQGSEGFTPVTDANSKAGQGLYFVRGWKETLERRP